MGNGTILVAKLFRGFSDPTRLAILRQLMGGSSRVTDLVDHLGCSQAKGRVTWRACAIAGLSRQSPKVERCATGW